MNLFSIILYNKKSLSQIPKQISIIIKDLIFLNKFKSIVRKFLLSLSNQIFKNLQESRKQNLYSHKRSQIDPIQPFDFSIIIIQQNLEKILPLLRKDRVPIKRTHRATCIDSSRERVEGWTRYVDAFPRYAYRSFLEVSSLLCDAGSSKLTATLGHVRNNRGTRDTRLVST